MVTQLECVRISSTYLPLTEPLSIHLIGAGLQLVVIETFVGYEEDVRVRAEALDQLGHVERVELLVARPLVKPLRHEPLQQTPPCLLDTQRESEHLKRLERWMA